MEGDRARAGEGKRLFNFNPMSLIFIGDAGMDCDLALSMSSFLLRPALFSFLVSPPLPSPSSSSKRMNEAGGISSTSISVLAVHSTVVSAVDVSVVVSVFAAVVVGGPVVPASFVIALLSLEMLLLLLL